MTERVLRRELEAAINDYRAGKSLEACLLVASEKVHPYLRIFDSLSVAQEPLDPGELRARLRRRFVSGAMSEIRASEASTSRLGRIAAAAAAAFIVGAAVNPVLAQELVDQVARTFGSAVSATVSRVLEVDSGPIARDASTHEAAPAQVVQYEIVDADFGPGSSHVASDTPVSRPGGPSHPAGDLPGGGLEPGTGGSNPPGQGLPDPDIELPSAPSAVAPPPAQPAASDSSPAAPPTFSDNPAPAAGDGGAPESAESHQPAEGPPASPPATAEETSAVSPPGVGLAHSEGRGDDLPEHANAGSRDTALDHAAESGKKVGQSGDTGNAGNPPGQANVPAGTGGPSGNSASEPGEVTAAGVGAVRTLPINPVSPGPANGGDSGAPVQPPGEPNASASTGPSAQDSQGNSKAAPGSGEAATGSPGQPPGQDKKPT